jgi:hypothetical protein
MLFGRTSLAIRFTDGALSLPVKPLSQELKGSDFFMKAMKMTVWIEGIVLLGTGIISLAEGLRLTQKIDPDAIADVLGPGYYIFSLGLLLMITGITYLLINYRKFLNMKKEASGGETEKQRMNRVVIYMVAVFIIYLTLINMAGYLVPTLIFFFLEFRLAGVKSWKRNLILTSVVAGIFYVVFIQYCRLIFPHGIF